MFLNKKVYGLALFVLAGCQSSDRSANLVLINRSDRSIHYWVTCDSTFKDLELKSAYVLNAHDSTRPFLLYGPEGKGPEKNPWVNAINRADDRALHVFYYYIDYKNDPDPSDSLYPLIIRRADYKVDSLDQLNWRIEYTEK
jgi:hypothetical protein